MAVSIGGTASVESVAPLALVGPTRSMPASDAPSADVLPVPVQSSPLGSGSDSNGGGAPPTPRPLPESALASTTTEDVHLSLSPGVSTAATAPAPTGSTDGGALGEPPVGAFDTTLVAAPSAEPPAGVPVGADVLDGADVNEVEPPSGCCRPTPIATVRPASEMRKLWYILNARWPIARQRPAGFSNSATASTTDRTADRAAAVGMQTGV